MKLREESVEAVDLLPLLDKCVVLGDPLQSELVHQVDLVGLLQMLPHERLHSEWKGGAVEEDLSLSREEADHLVQHPFEILAQELVGLVKNQQLEVVDGEGRILVQMPQKTTRSTNQDVAVRDSRPFKF